MADEKGDISGTFRSRKPSIDRRIREIQDRLKQETSNRKTSVNQTLNFAVMLGSEYLDQQKEEIQEKKSEKKKLDEVIDDLENSISELIEF